MDEQAETLALLALSAALTVAAPAFGEAQIPCRYDIAVIRGPWCSQFFEYPTTRAEGLGSDSRIVGDYDVCDIGPDRAFVWSPESGMLELPRPNGYLASRAFDLDAEANWIVGSVIADPDGTGLPRATLWNNMVPTVLGVPAGGTDSEAVAVANGRVVGTWRGGVLGLQAFLWHNGTMVSDLDLPMGPSSAASDVNRAGAVVGWMGQLFAIDSHAYLWRDGTTTDLGVIPGGFTAYALAINDTDPPGVVGAGQIPWKGNQFGMARAFYWKGGTMIALPTPDGVPSSAWDVADDGTIVGTVLGWTGYAATLWRDGVVVNLNDRIPAGTGIHLDYASAINEQGKIPGVGYDGEDLIAFLLTPAAPVPGDLGCDGIVSHDDLVILLDAWGPCNLPQPCPADIDGDARVGIVDFLILLGNWG